MAKTKVGIIGCGNICDIYFSNMRDVFENVEVKSCADIIHERAQAKAEEYGVSAVTVDELLADDEISIVVNLTIPQAHYEVGMKAVEAGKNVHSEKPLTLTRKEGEKLLKAAKKKGVLVGCAPDTFMGGGIQTCRKLIDDGAIGEPIAATAFMMCHGHEGWHPDPEFYYKTGGGPMFDMGPYYLTALVALVGPIKRVSGLTRITFPERTIGSEEKKGQKIEVEVPTHVAGLIDFANGAVGTIITTFDVWGANLPDIEIHGSNASISVPDPNTFGGVVKIKRPDDENWSEVTLTHGYTENSRGIGPSDMAAALAEDRPHRANGELAYHVLDVMHAFHDSSDKGKFVTLKSTCRKPEALKSDLLS